MLLLTPINGHADPSAIINGYGAVTDSSFKVSIYATSVECSLISYGVKLDYNPVDLEFLSAHRYEDIWYLGDGQTNHPYKEPIHSEDGYIEFVGGRIDINNPTAGVSGNEILFAEATFNRRNSNTPDFSLSLANSNGYVNFVTTEGVKLDESQGVTFNNPVLYSVFINSPQSNFIVNSQNRSSFAISGIAPPLSAVDIYSSEILISSTTSDENGQWSVVADFSNEPQGTISLRASSAGEFSQWVEGVYEIIEPDTDSPRIVVPPTVTAITDTTAIIEWKTDENSSSEVRYGINPFPWELFDNIKADAELKTEHLIMISGLTASTQYYFTVGATDTQGNGPDPDNESGNNPFIQCSFITEATPDILAPIIISGPIVTSVDRGSATIEWVTNEPANSIIKYGMTSDVWSGYAQLVSSSSLNTQHRITLFGLSTLTTYYFRVGSIDPHGNGPDLHQGITNPSLEHSFSTLEIADNSGPQISDIEIAWVTNSTALIQWKTDEPSNSEIRYDMSPGTWDTYPFRKVDPKMVIEHSMTITNLHPNTNYYFTLGSADIRSNGPTISAEFTLTTEEGPDTSAPQIVQGVSVQVLSDTSAVILWNTDEPGNSQVRYDTFLEHSWESYIYSENELCMTKNHSVVLTGLTPNTRYYFAVSNMDASGNSDINNPEFTFLNLDENPPSIIVFPDEDYPKVNSESNLIDFTYDELNMQNAEDEFNYHLLSLINGNISIQSVGLFSSSQNSSTYRLSLSDIDPHDIFTLTVNENVTDAYGNSVQPNVVVINDNDIDELPDDWEVEFGLDPTNNDPSYGEGKAGDFDSDGYSNYVEFINDTYPDDDTSFPSPPELLDCVPHQQAGIDDTFRVPNNSSFGVYISDSGGIDITDNNSVVLTVNDQTNKAYSINIGDTDVARIIKMNASDPDTVVTSFWFVYDRSMDASYGDFPFGESVNISVTVENVNGYIAIENYSFRIETEAEHDSVPTDPSIPDYSAVDPSDPDMNDATYAYNMGYQVDSGIMQGAKILYNDLTEPHEDLLPSFAPTDGIPNFSQPGNILGIGDLINVQPSTIFNTPVKVIIPTLGESASLIKIYVYNGEWTLASDTDGSSDLPGWMVNGSRVNNASSIELKVYHFSGVHAAVAGPVINDDDDGGGGGGGGTGCFIETLFWFFRAE